MSGNFEIDLKKGHEELYRLRSECKELPEDPLSSQSQRITVQAGK